MTEELKIAIVSGILALIPLLFNAYRESKLLRITDERTKWRNEIREITQTLSDVMHTKENSDRNYMLYDALNKLKVRINSYGKNSCDIHSDSHIWDSIEKIEKEGFDKGKEEINKIIIYLSLLLKFDWERSKSEASINLEKVFGYAFCIVAAVWYVYLNFSFKQINDVVLVVIPVVFFVFLIMFPQIMMCINDKINKKKDMLIFWIVNIIIITPLLFVLFVKPNMYGLGNLTYPLLFWLMSAISFAIGNYKTVKAYNNYEKAVNAERYQLKSKKQEHTNIFGNFGNKRKQ